MFGLEKKAFKKLQENMEFATLIAYLITSTDQVDVVIAKHKLPEDMQAIPPVKNQYIGNNLYMYYPIATNYDALVRTYPGQNVWRVLWSSFHGRNPQIGVVNPMMMIWGANDQRFMPGKGVFPVTAIYAIAQEVWTSDVQRARRGMLTFYGKACVRPEAAAILFTPPGEDSGSFLVLQGKQPKIESTQIDWFLMHWSRPTLLDSSIANTELRYAYNVTRFMMDRNQFSLFFNPDLPADKKLSHLFLWFHYFISVFALALLILLPGLSPFSPFAYLTPMTFFIIFSLILMEAINTNNFVRHWRKSGSFWKAGLLMARDIVIAFPFYVSLVPMFFKGIWYASNEIFKFISTIKLSKLSSYDKKAYFNNTMLFHPFGLKKGIAFNSLLGIAGIIGFGIGLFFMTSVGPLVLIPYLLASVSFLTGMRVYNVFVDRKGRLTGTSYRKMFTELPSLAAMTVAQPILPQRKEKPVKETKLRLAKREKAKPVKETVSQTQAASPVNGPSGSDSSDRVNPAKESLDARLSQGKKPDEKIKKTKKKKKKPAETTVDGKTFKQILDEEEEKQQGSSSTVSENRSEDAELSWHHRLTGRVDPFSAGLLLQLLYRTGIYSLTDVVKALSHQQRAIGLVNSKEIAAMETEKIGPYQLTYTAPRDVRKNYKRGLNLEAEPKNSWQMLKRLPKFIKAYRLDTVHLFIKRLYLDLARSTSQGRKKCNLCSEFMPLIQRGFNWRKYRILINPFAWSPDHNFVVNSRKHTAEQTETIDSKAVINSALNFIEQAPGVSFVLNSIARSIPEHFHFQGMLRPLPIEQLELTTLSNIDQGMVGAVISWPIEHLLIKGRNRQAVEEAVMAAVESYGQKGYSPERIDADFYKRGDEYSVFLAPRTNLYASKFREGWGAEEMAGYLVINNKVDFAKLKVQPQLLNEILQEVGKAVCCNTQTTVFSRVRLLTSPPSERWVSP